jgi:hypothetical protein
LALRIHADDLHAMFEALVAEAQHYEAHVARKYEREDPWALAAHKWMEAGLVGLTIVTWLRESNVAKCTPRNLFKREDGTWYFHFARPQMKSRRDHADHVVDLWKGRSAQALLSRVLDRCVALRPRLLDRFRQENRGKPDPETFFLNFRGRTYSTSAVRCLFASASQRYLGLSKRLSPHDVRTIVPTWLFVREGLDILPTVQRRLDHAHIQTTHQFYLKVERLFDSRFAQARIEEKAKERRLHEQLHRMPDEIVGTVERVIREQQAAGSGAIDEETLRRLLMSVLEELKGDGVGEEEKKEDV